MGPKRESWTRQFIQTGSTDIGQGSGSSRFKELKEPFQQTSLTTVQRIVSQVELNMPTSATRTPHVIMTDSEDRVGSGGQQADLAMRLRLAELRDG